LGRSFGQATLLKRYLRGPYLDDGELCSDKKTIQKDQKQRKNNIHRHKGSKDKKNTQML